MESYVVRRSMSMSTNAGVGSNRIRMARRCAALGVILVSALAASFAVPAQQATVSRSAGDYAERLARIERLLDGQALFELSNRMEALQMEVQQMRGELETQAYALEQMRNRQRDLYVDIDQRLQGRQMVTAEPLVNNGAAPLDPSNPPLEVLRGLAPSAGVDDGPGAPAAALSVEQVDNGLRIESQTSDAARMESRPPPPAATVAVVRPGRVARSRAATFGGPVDETAAETSYRAALSLLKAGQYDQSKAAFDGFLVEHPNSAYADNAQYWLGEAYYVTRDFAPAMQEYTKLVQAFPDSQKVEHALLKIGYCQQELGNLSAAIAQLEEVTSLYPGGSAARKAQERLQQLRL